MFRSHGGMGTASNLRLRPRANSSGARFPGLPCSSFPGHRHLATSDLLRRFVDSRERVEEIAARIFHITPEWVSGPVSIWADDIDDPPPACALAREIVPFMGGVQCDLGLVS